MTRPSRDDVAPGLGVIGGAVLDTIRPIDGPAVQSLGGITHSLHALTALAPHPSFVVPALKVGADAASFIAAELAGLGVDARFVRHTTRPQNKVELLYTSPGTRRETLKGGVPPLSARELAPFLAEIDFLYLNFVAGNELTLATLQRLRRQFSGPVYADVHSLVLGRAPNGVRFPRPLRNWRSWVSCFDMVQCNIEEAATLWHSREGAPRELPRTLDDESLARLAAEVLKSGPRVLLVTDGAAPVRVWTSAGHRWTIEAENPEEARDPTGCGDVLGAAFCALHFLAELPVRVALERAVAAASFKATRIGTAGLAVAIQAWYLGRFG